MSNMLIAQSGGPSMVINQSLVGAVLAAKKERGIKKVLGALHGIDGIMNEQFIDLKKEKVRVLEKVAKTPSSALGSVRKKPGEQDCRRIFEVLQANAVKHFFYIGGNDSAETAHIINEAARKAGHEMSCYHIPKTIDNDLRENDHTPGFGSAAKFVASALMGDNLDNRALGGVKIDVVMGRHAGFLTAASALARVYPGDGPHLIYLPERPFDVGQFVKDVQAVYAKQGRCVVAVSEGISDANGTPIVSKFIDEMDSHGNVQLSGTGALGDLLAKALKEATDIARVRADTFGYLQRSFAGVVSDVDAAEARAVGRVAVENSLRVGGSGSIAIKRRKGTEYGVDYVPVPLRNVAKETRHMPAKFINRAGNDVTKAFVDYVTPIVGKLPPIGRFEQLM